MHKNIQTVAGCITRITCNFTTPDNQAPEITAYCLVEKEYRAATKEAGGVLLFPAMEYGQHLYEVRADGKPVIHGHFLIRPSAFPHEGGVVDYTMNAELGTVEALKIDLLAAPGPRGPQGLSAYDVARQNGFEGSESEWLESLKQDAAVYAAQVVESYLGQARQAAADALNAQVLAEAAAMQAIAGGSQNAAM